MLTFSLGNKYATPGDAVRTSEEFTHPDRREMQEQDQHSPAQAAIPLQRKINSEAGLPVRRYSNL